MQYAINSTGFAAKLEKGGKCAPLTARSHNTKLSVVSQDFFGSLEPSQFYIQKLLIIYHTTIADNAFSASRMVAGQILNRPRADN
jgi:hypothetical protein